MTVARTASLVAGGGCETNSGAVEAGVTRWIETVYRRERQGLFVLALSITSSHQQAEDAVHEAIVRVCRQRRPPAGDHAAYVYRAVRNAAIDERRRAGVRQASPFDEANHQPPAAGDAHDTIAAAESRRLVQAAVESLPDDLREVVVLRLANDLSFRQMSDVLNEPTMTISDRYRRALNTLRASLENLS